MVSRRLVEQRGHLTAAFPRPLDGVGYILFRQVVGGDFGPSVFEGTGGMGIRTIRQIVPGNARLAVRLSGPRPRRCCGI